MSHDIDELLQRSLLELRELRRRLRAPESGRREPIAVVGVGCRFPRADGPEAFWRLLRDGVDAVGEMPAWRRPAELVDAALLRGGFVDGLDLFDAGFFGISPAEAARMDPQQRLFLEVAWEALEDASVPPDSLGGSRTGVFLGVHSHSSEYAIPQLEHVADLTAHSGPGTSHSVIAGRLSHHLDLRGPSLVVDTACSSSLMAMHLACQSLRAGECDLALVGGVNVMLTTTLTLLLRHMDLLAADGKCKAFDARADGIGRGEGCGVVVLRRLADAQAAGEPVRAVVRGSAANQDGQSNGLTAPSGAAQRAVLRDALRNADVAPASISFIEAHGTGTPLGDPIEMEALLEVLGEGRSDEPCTVGSVKANLGHLEGAAGIAGFIKAVLCLQERTLVPQPHFRQLNPEIPRAPWLDVPTAPRSWPEAGRRAGVSSFGWSGTNVHVVLEEAPPPADAQPASTGPWLLPISARSEGALRALAERFAAALKGRDPCGDVCFTAQVGRSHLPYRLAVLGASADELIEGLGAAARSDPHPRVFVGHPEQPPATASGASGVRAAAERYVRGDAPEWSPAPRGRRVPLPRYPWQRTRHWFTPSPARESRSLLGRRVSSPLLVHETELGEATPLLLDHEVFGGPVVPATAWLEMAVSAARPLGAAHAIENVVLHQPLVLDAPRRVQTVVDAPGRQVRIWSGEGETWVLHFEAGLAPLGDDKPSPLRRDDVRVRCREKLEGEAFRADLVGLRYRGAFRAVEAVWRCDGEALARLRSVPDDGYRAHPGLLDACAQPILAALPERGRAPYLPIAIARYRLLGPLTGPLWSHSRLRAGQRLDGETVVGDLHVYDDEGRAVAVLEGVTLKRADRLGVRSEAEIYAPAWQPADAGPTAVSPAHWLIVGDGHGLGAELARRLGARGRAYAFETEGGAWRAALLTGDPQAGVVHVGSLDLASAPDGNHLLANQRLGCGEVLALVRAVAGTARPLVVVTRGAQVEASAVEQSAVWGLARTVELELPDLPCRFVDLDPTSADPAGSLLDELACGNAERQVARRDAARLVRRLERVAAGGAAAALRADRAYAITGAMGALGRQVVRALVEMGARELVLIGRRPPRPDIAGELGELRRGGVRITVAAADVSRDDQLAAVLAQRDRPLGGVFHLAGVLDDTPIVSQDWPRFAEVLRPKMAGAWNLHALTRDDPLEHFVMFSSAAALLGGRGQAAYACANAFLDALALHRRAQGLPASSVGWGPWSAAGMAASLPVRDRDRLAELGVGWLDPDNGRELFARLLGRDEPQLVPLVVDWHRHVRTLGGVPALLSHLAPAAAPAVPAGNGLGLRTLVRELLARALGLPSGDEIRGGEAFRSLGLDSLGAVELRNHLMAALGRPLPATLIFDYATVDTLTDFLEDPAPAPETAGDSSLDALRALSDEEATALLEAELDRLEGRD